MVTFEQAHELLKKFDCGADCSPDQSPVIERSQLQEALLTVIQKSDYQILGICADDVDQGYAALVNYAKALELPIPELQGAIAGSVYMKYNSRAGRFLIDTYTEKYRGVLVACQSDFADGLNDMYGHLPLDLFQSQGE